jgi:ATP-dependent Clp protease ATP-binding subunit ClpX
LLELDSIKLIFEDGALVEVVKMAKARTTGARALRAIMEEVMLEIMYKLPSLTGVQTCTITEETVCLGTEPLLTFKKSKKTA